MIYLGYNTAIIADDLMVFQTMQHSDLRKGMSCNCSEAVRCLQGILQ